MTFKTFLKRHWDEGVVYVLTLIASIYSSSLEAFKGQGPVEIDLSWGRLGLAAFLSFIMVLLMELIPFWIPGTDKEASHKGKQKKFNLIKRFLVACVFGFASPYIIDMLIKQLLQKVGS